MFVRHPSLVLHTSPHVKIEEAKQDIKLFFSDDDGGGDGDDDSDDDQDGGGDDDDDDDDAGLENGRTQSSQFSSQVCKLVCHAKGLVFFWLVPALRHMRKLHHTCNFHQLKCQKCIYGVFSHVSAHASQRMMRRPNHAGTETLKGTSTVGVTWCDAGATPLVARSSTRGTREGDDSWDAGTKASSLNSIAMLSTSFHIFQSYFMIFHIFAHVTLPLHDCL